MEHLLSPFKKPNYGLLCVPTTSNYLHKLSSNFKTQSVKVQITIHRMKQYSATQKLKEDVLKQSSCKSNLKYTAKSTSKTNKNKQRNIDTMTYLFVYLFLPTNANHQITTSVLINCYVSVVYLQYSDAYQGPSQHSRPNSLQNQSTTRQPLTSVTKKSIPNAHGVLDQPQLIRFSRIRYRTRSNRIWFGQEGTRGRPYRPCHQASYKWKEEVLQNQDTTSYLKLLLLIY